jgi:hypothetical protein
MELKNDITLEDFVDKLIEELRGTKKRTHRLP